MKPQGQGSAVEEGVCAGFTNKPVDTRSESFIRFWVALSVYRGHDRRYRHTERGMGVLRNTSIF